jgi:hypothetical protein
MTTRKQWTVCSGEGEIGTVERKVATERGIKRILTVERCGGDRWARATEILAGETTTQASERGLCLGTDY